MGTNSKSSIGNECNILPLDILYNICLCRYDENIFEESKHMSKDSERVLRVPLKGSFLKDP